MDKKVPKLNASNKNNEEYEEEAIWDNAVYMEKSELGQLLGLYYLIVWKGYFKEKNT